MHNECAIMLELSLDRETVHVVDNNPMPHQPPEDSRTRTQAFDPAASQSDPWLGRMAGNYHILSKLGSGGFGAVYTARDIHLDRMVALKMLRYPEDSVARADLLKEARVLAKLGELAGVVQIFGWGEVDDNCYFALEMLPRSAADLLRESPCGLPAAQALELLIPCAEALAQAHARGIVHGDIKPANILSDGGRGKLCDFGLARFYRRPSPVGGMAIGSPAFMAPEQLRGEAAGPASDVFAIGVTLYQLLSGQLPFDRPTPEETTAAILENHWRPLRDLMPSVDAQLERIVDACLAPDPALRYPSAKALADALRACRTRGKSARSGRDRRRIVLPFAAALLAVVLGAVLFPLLETSLHSGGANTAQAEARNLLEQGNYQAAAEAFQEALAGGAADDRVRYGLGYALLLDGKLKEAETAFASIEDPVRAAEGHAAVAQARNDSDAPEDLAEAARQDESSYASVLLASADLSAGHWSEARDRLAQLDENDLDYNWQRARLWQSLGTAHFRLGEVAEARAAFERAADKGNTQSAAVAEGYLEITERELAREAREDLSAQIARLRDLRDRTPDVETADRWTSRPMRVWIPPVDVGNSAIAADSGLADVLPWRLSTALFAQTDRPVDVVDRSITASLLSEQELSAQLSAPEDTVRLGGFLGARVAVLCQANTVFGEQALSVSLVDVETSRRIPAGEFPLNRATALAPLVEEISRAVVTALEKAYPLRGQVRQTDEGLRINIGTDTGLKAGMSLKLMTGPGTEYTLPGISATVAEPIGASTAGVTLVPADTTVPTEGWHAEATPQAEVDHG